MNKKQVCFKYFYGVIYFSNICELLSELAPIIFMEELSTRKSRLFSYTLIIKTGQYRKIMKNASTQDKNMPYTMIIRQIVPHIKNDTTAI